MLSCFCSYAPRCLFLLLPPCLIPSFSLLLLSSQSLSSALTCFMPSCFCLYRPRYLFLLLLGRHPPFYFPSTSLTASFVCSDMPHALFLLLLRASLPFSSSLTVPCFSPTRLTAALVCSDVPYQSSFFCCYAPRCLFVLLPPRPIPSFILLLHASQPLKSALTCLVMPSFFCSYARHRLFILLSCASSLRVLPPFALFITPPSPLGAGLTRSITLRPDEMSFVPSFFRFRGLHHPPPSLFLMH